jgi:hypothetical protein
MKAKITNLTEQRKEEELRLELKKEQKENKKAEVISKLKQIQIRNKENYKDLRITYPYTKYYGESWSYSRYTAFHDYEIKGEIINEKIPLMDKIAYFFYSWKKFKNIGIFLSYNDTLNKISIYNKDIWEDNKEYISKNFKEVVLDF